MTPDQERPRVVSASREIAAEPGRIFELIADPAQQPRWDGGVVMPLMIALHRELRGGVSLAEALRDARRGSGSDPVDAATGWSFICLGAG